MESRIMQVFYGNDALPYKDKERSVHYPIVGSAFMGASNTTEIRFYTRDIGGRNRDWIVIGKLPNGKRGFKVLSNSVYDDEVDEYYYPFSLTQFFTQFKGDLYFSLGGYNGNDTTLNEEEFYEMEGNPVIETTGSIKINIAYATPLNGSDEEIDTWQEFLSALGTKADKSDVIIVYDTYGALEGEYDNFENGQMFYAKDKQMLYTRSGGTLSLLSNNIGIIRTSTIANGTTLDKDIASLDVCFIINTSTNVIYRKTSVESGVAHFVNELEFIFGNSNGNDVFGRGEFDITLSSGVISNLNIVSKDFYNKAQVDNKFYNKSEVDIRIGDCVPKVRRENKIYATGSTLPIQQITLDYSVNPSSNSVPQRDSSGRLIVNSTPTANNEATSKQYVDNNFAKLNGNNVFGGTNTYENNLPQSEIEATNGYDFVNLLKAQALEQEAKNYTDQKVAELQAKSDVIDVLGNLSELRAFNTEEVSENDIINVLSDSNHDNASTFYKLRDAESGETYIEPTTPNPHGWVWVFIGEEGPFLTPNDADSKYQTKIISYQLLNIPVASWTQNEDTGKWYYSVVVSSADLSIGAYDKYMLGANDKDSSNEIADCNVNVETITTSGANTTITLVGNFKPSIVLNLSVVIAKVSPSAYSGITFLTTDDIDTDYIVIEDNKLTVSSEIKDLIAYAKSQGWIN